MPISSDELELTVRWVDLEGGFWGLIGPDGARYEPVSGLPPDLQHEGQQLRARLRAVPVFSFRMWGTPVDVQLSE